MPFEITYNDKDDYIVSTFTGLINMTMVHEYLDALIPVLEKTGARRLLSDSTEAQVQVSAMDIMQFPHLAEASPLTAGLKRAALAAEGSSGYLMYETFSKMQGQNVRVFTDRDEAVQWLLTDEEAAPSDD